MPSALNASRRTCRRPSVACGCNTTMSASDGGKSSGAKGAASKCRLTNSPSTSKCSAISARRISGETRSAEPDSQIHDASEPGRRQRARASYQTNEPNVFPERGATYRIDTSEGGLTYIQCLVCGYASFHPGDVENRSCGNCHVFHERAEVHA